MPKITPKMEFVNSYLERKLYDFIASKIRIRLKLNKFTYICT